jgi:transposase
MDTSKHVFQLHGVNAAEAPVLRKKMRRKEMVAFFKKLAPTVIAIEACGASHHLARLLQSFGHTVKLIAPQLVKPYVKRGKNDAADAEALCEAMSRPTMRFVPVKTTEQQATLMLVGVRDRLIRNRTQLANTIRGYAAEFGEIAAKGMAHLVPLLERIQADESLPVLARELFAIQAKEYVELQTQIDEVEAKLTAWHRADECSRRLAKIPSVGPIGAVLLRMKTPDPAQFRSGRQFAAWIGLTPKANLIDIRGRIGNIERPAEQMLAVEPLIPGDRRRKPKDTARSFRNARAPEALVERIGDARSLEYVVHVELDVPTSASDGEIRDQSKQPLHDLPTFFQTAKQAEARRPKTQRGGMVGKLLHRLAGPIGRWFELTRHKMRQPIRGKELNKRSSGRIKADGSLELGNGKLFVARKGMQQASPL